MNRTYITGLLAAASLLAAAPVARAQDLAGRWDAVVNIGGVDIPFRLDIRQDRTRLFGTLYNGDDTETTTSGTLSNGTATLKWEHYLTTIVAAENNGQLVGRVEARGDKEATGNPFSAVRHVERAAPATRAPEISGNWIIPHESPKGEKAWRFIVKQKGNEAQAAILRVDGDTGALTGAWQDGHFLLSHFDGSRPARMEVRPRPDGTLEIIQKGSNRDGVLIAYREDVAKARGLPQPADYRTHTTVRDENEVFTFKFPDVHGQMLSNEDPKFKNKVVVAIVTGTWCPNCHDEAQYLVQLYKKYRDQGLEIVALDFEEPEQQDELNRVHAFIAKYGVDYTYLIAGAPAEMWEKVPQLVNLNTWPATVFVGRDGRVKGIHAGFAAPASGVFYDELQVEFTSTIERLLAERVPATDQQ